MRSHNQRRPLLPSFAPCLPKKVMLKIKKVPKEHKNVTNFKRNINLSAKKSKISTFLGIHSQNRSYRASIGIRASIGEIEQSGVFIWRKHPSGRGGGGGGERGGERKGGGKPLGLAPCEQMDESKFFIQWL